jgi:hypothetical protein
VEFFEPDDLDCDKTSFHYWWGGYNPAWDGRIVLLKTDLRKEMNWLLQRINMVISAAIDRANAETGRVRVHYVDLVPRFREHRWCERGDFHEPASDRKYVVPWRSHIPA